ncbi:MAG: nicotinate (nicotinamide) nucleotide adenylyltransferase [Planctomycetes bacterium]|nr:nicotinate (nicotinamide) nucleotide adenylyltransferase [Planctomycetota bacterium]
MKVVVFGGTFNPIHNGHIRIARAVMQRFSPDKILFIPTPSKHFAHRSTIKALACLRAVAQHRQAPYRHRLEMVKLAIKKYRNFEASDIEAKIRNKGRLIYSILTLRRLKKIYPADKEFYFIIGMDTLRTLNKWRNIQELMKLCRFIVAPRPGYKRLSASRRPSGQAGPKSMPLQDKSRRLYLAGVRINISSTLIRERLAKNLPVKSLVPPAVERYIRQYGLYSSPTNYEWTNYE